MDSAVPPRLLPLIHTAVEMRFECKTWEEISQRVRRRARTCRHWPLRYPREWNRYYARLRNSYLMDHCREALGYLRKHMHSENPIISAAAARHWDKNCEKLFARCEAADQKADDPETQKVLRVVEQTKGLTDGQLAQVLEAVLEDLRTRADSNGAGTPTPAPPERE
ncbi:MAG TPA: hypothetical protein VKI65_12705 [Gemmataceae bacterium]|nr:hypothetical protein [Gemmataceae bacterium]